MAGAGVMGILGMVGQTASLIGSNLDMGKARKELGALGERDPKYHGSRYPFEQVGLANSLMNARMPGGTAVERNIYQNQASRLGNIQRNATDSSQALALGAATAGQTNQAFNQLGIQESQDYYNRLQNLNQAQNTATEEERTQFDDKVRRWQDQLGILMKRNEMRQQQWSNLNNYSQSLGSMGGGIGGGSGGGMGGMMGG